MTELAARGPTGALGIGRTRSRFVRAGALALVCAFVLAAGTPGVGYADDDDGDGNRSKKSPRTTSSTYTDRSSGTTSDSGSSSDWTEVLSYISDRVLGDVNPTNIPTTGDDVAAKMEDGPDVGGLSVEEQLGLDRIGETRGGHGIRVAVLDGGFRLDHPAIADRIIGRGLDMIERDDDAHDPGNGRDDDGDGIVDDALGHGTFVAGMVLRVAPEAEVLPVRVRDDEGRGTDWHLAMGIDAAVDAGVDVINLSVDSAEWGMRYWLERSIANARSHGIAVVVSAGNDGEADLSFLAGLDGVVAACAVDRFDCLAPFSNYETDPTVARVLCAPGVDLIGPAGICEPDDLAMWSGTSFSAGLVSGCVALMLGDYPKASADEVLDRLTASSAPVGLPDGSTLPTGGRVDLAAAVAR